MYLHLLFICCKYILCYEANWLMLFTEIIQGYSETRVKHIYIRYLKK